VVSVNRNVVRYNKYVLVITVVVVFSELTFTFAICYSPSVCCRLSVCLSVCNAHAPTQAVEIFGNISPAFGILAVLNIHIKFYADRPRGTPPPGELNTKGIAKYSDFGPIDGYISETVQDRR